MKPSATRKKGRPRTKRRPIPTAGPLRLFTAYDPNWPSIATPAEIAERIRQFTSNFDSADEVHLVGWINGIAKAVETGNSVQVAHCAMNALEEMHSLVMTILVPMAKVGAKKLAADKRKGYRTTGHGAVSADFRGDTRQK